MTQLKRGDIVKGTTFKGEEVVRNAFVVVQLSNGVDERHDLNAEVTLIQED